MKTFKEIVKELVKKNTNRVVTATVINVMVTQESDYAKVNLRLDKNIPGMVKDEENDTYIASSEAIDVVFSSNWSIRRALLQNADTAFAADYLAEHPKELKRVLSYAKVKILCEEVPFDADAEDNIYVNPFDCKEAEVEVEHESIYHHVIGVEVDKRAARYIDTTLTEKIVSEDDDIED